LGAAGSSIRNQPGSVTMTQPSDPGPIVTLVRGTLVSIVVAHAEPSRVVSSADGSLMIAILSDHNADPIWRGEKMRGGRQTRGTHSFS
jgi:hypothetical protein